MKVAVLLRGEPRHFKEGQILLEHLLLQRFPDIDFKVFAAVTPTIIDTKSQKTSPYSFSDFYYNFSPVYSTSKLEHDIIDNIIKTYKSPQFVIVENNQVIKSVEILIDKYYEKAASYGKPIIQKIDRTVNRIDIICRWFYFFSQYTNYISSRKLLIDYSVENDWYADLIINTRYDVCFNFNDNFFEEWESLLTTKKIDILANIDNDQIAGYVFPFKMFGRSQNIWIDDLLFVEVYKKQMYKHYNRPVSDIFLDYVTLNLDWTEYIFESLNQHYFWNIIFSDMLVCSYPTGNNLIYIRGLLRPCSNFDLISDIVNFDHTRNYEINQKVENV
jgi:hypothetical protein